MDSGPGSVSDVVAAALSKLRLKKTRQILKKLCNNITSGFQTVCNGSAVGHGAFSSGSYTFGKVGIKHY